MSDSHPQLVVSVTEALDVISTGHLPPSKRIDDLVAAAYAQYRGLREGQVATYIPALAAADPEYFGLSVCEVDGNIHTAGQSNHEFSIQSISKAFVYALVCDQLGHVEAHKMVGVNNTGLPFNSVMAMELNDGRPMNPMVNAGAIATTSLIPGDTADDKWTYIREGLSRFAGRPLELDDEVYSSEVAGNQRNRALAELLDSYGHIRFDPIATTDVYTKQCSLRVTARDLSIMAATLADGGVNPLTGERVISPINSQYVLAALASAGMYEHSGDWLFEIGVPAKSGVSGGIIAISPGKGALASYSPLLDSAGNSVRGQRATRFLSQALGLNLFASRAV